MPFATNSALPDEVKALPAGAQTVWRKTFNATYPRSGEEAAFKIAWSAVKLAGWRKVGDGWEMRKISRSQVKKALRYLVTTLAKQRDDDGVMVGYFLPPEIADQLTVPGGESPEQLHVTLAYLPDDPKDSFDDARARELLDAVSSALAESRPLTGRIGGSRRFAGVGDGTMDAIYATVNVRGIKKLQRDVADAVEEAGFTVSRDHAFVPHVTLAYVPAGMDLPTTARPPVELTIDHLDVAFGSKRHPIPLGTPETGPPLEGAQYGVTKAVEEKRYTFGPIYLPERLDAHGEFTTADILQAAAWEYFRKGQRDIHLQHGDKVIGELVELSTWPHEVRAQLALPGQAPETRVLPAGTLYAGVVWTKEAWPLVKAGKIRGYSMGGKARRVNVKL